MSYLRSDRMDDDGSWGRRHDEAAFFGGCVVCFVSCKRQDRVKKGRRESFLFYVRRRQRTEE